MTREETSRLVAVMLASVPNHRVDSRSVPDMINAYADLLSDLSYEQCNAAVRALLQTRTWLPSVADIRSTALELTRGPVRAGGEAWGGVLNAMKYEGAYRTPGVEFVFSDPVTARCVSALGWKELCLSENTIADRARFIDMYDGLAVQDRREVQSPVLGAASEHRALQAGDAVRALIERTAKQFTDEPS
jgi:hypothetical protein